MKRFVLLMMFVFASLSMADRTVDVKKPSAYRGAKKLETFQLPDPELIGQVPIEQVINNRGKDARFTNESLDVAQVAQLLWAGYGQNEAADGGRTVESQDEGYSLKLYVVTTQNVYTYDPINNALDKVGDKDVRSKLAVAAKKNRNIYGSVMNIVVAGSVRKAGHKIPRSGRLYMLLEAGRVSQNIELQAIGMGLGVAATANFDADKVKSLLRMPAEYDALNILTIGNIRADQKYNFVPLTSAQPAVAETPKAPVRKRAVIIIPERAVIEEDFFNTDSILKLSKIEVDVASFTLKRIRGDLRGLITPNILVREIDTDEYDAIVLVGSVTALKQYSNERLVADIVQEAYDKGKIVAALGKTPRVFAEANIVRGLYVTSHTSLRKTMERAGAEWTNTPLEISGNVITGQGTESISQLSSSEGVIGVTRFASAVARAIEGAEQDDYTEGTQPYMRRETRRREKFY